VISQPYEAGAGGHAHHSRAPLSLLGQPRHHPSAGLGRPAVLGLGLAIEKEDRTAAESPLNPRPQLDAEDARLLAPPQRGLQFEHLPSVVVIA